MSQRSFSKMRKGFIPIFHFNDEDGELMGKTRFVKYLW